VRTEQEKITWLESYEEVRDAFSHPTLVQASYESAKKTVFANVLVTLDGPAHLQRRRTEMALVKPHMLSLLEQTTVPTAAKRILTQFAQQQEMDLVDALRIVTTAMACDIVGLDGCDSVEQINQLDRLTRKLHEGATIDWSVSSTADLASELKLAMEQYRNEFLLPSLNRRRSLISETPAPTAQHIDLLTILLSHTELLDMNDTKIMHESIHFLLATAHTSANAVVHAFDDYWTWLADHPEDQSRMSDPAFIQRCIHETLRLRPPTGFQKRIAPTDCALKSGRQFQAGEMIGLNLITASRDPKYYGATAAEYNPDRVTPEQVPRYGFAFGLGAHNCLGKRLSTGAQNPDNGAGVLVVLFTELLALHCCPHRSKPPLELPTTLRHQFSSYPTSFDAQSTSHPSNFRPLIPVQASTV